MIAHQAFPHYLARMLLFITLIVAVHSCTDLTNRSEMESADAAGLACGMNDVVCSTFEPDQKCHITSVSGDIVISNDAITAVIFPQLVNVTGRV